MHSSVCPLLAGEVYADAEGGRYLLVPQASKLAQLDHLGRHRVFDRQPIEGLVQSEEVVVRVRGSLVDKVDSTAPCRPVSDGLYAVPTRPGCAHRQSRRGEEMTAAVPELCRLDVHEPEVSLMNQCCCLESMTGSLVS